MINLCQGKKTVFFVVVVITACFLTNGRVLAQETLVTFDGSVTDDKGDVLPGASVNLKNIEAGYTYSAVTRSSGRFIILGIEPGQYEVEVSLSGFVTQIRRGMTFTVGARITVNFQLGIATVEEKIEVIAESPLIEVTKSEISSVISRREIDDLPVLSRNFAQLATLKAGTAGGDDDIRGGGQPAGSSEVLVDGVSNEFAWYNVQRSNLPMDAIQEYRVLINQFGAEYGNATAIVLVAITKSGTNEFKGRAYAFTRNETFDTKNYFADEKEEFSQYRFGGFLGGPIQKDKLHFFLSYEGSRYKEYSIITSPLVPYATVPVKTVNDQFLVKLNYQLNEKNMLSLRYTRDAPRTLNAGVGGFNTQDLSYDETMYDNVFQLNWTFYPKGNIMNEVRIQYSDRYYKTEGNEMSGSPDNYQIYRPSGRFGKYWGNPMWWPEKRFQLNDNLSINLNKHSLKLGFDINYVNSKVTSYWGSPGMFYFDTDDPFDAANADTYPYRFRWNAAAPSTEWYRMTNIAGFVQDRWKIHPKLTLNIGLRYSHYLFAKNPNQERFAVENKYNFDPRIGFSWDPIGDGKTAIRGGVGKYTNSPMGNVIYAAVVSRIEYDERIIDNPGYPDPLAPNPFFPGGELSLPKEDYTFTRGPNPNSIQYTLGVQRQITTDISLSADAVLSKGKHLYWFVNLNGIIPGTSTVRPDPTVGNHYDIQPGGHSDFKALYLNLKKRYSRGWGFEASYTLSQAKADVESGNWNSPSHNEDRWLDYGPTNNDALHRLSVAGIFDLPLGFQFSTIFYYRSALPSNIVTGNDDNLDGIWTDFPAGERRNSGRGFEYYSLDARVSKYIDIGPRFNIQIFAEMFNLTNRVNYNSPVANMTSSNFGEANSAQDPRLIQLGLRVNF